MYSKPYHYFIVIYLLFAIPLISAGQSGKVKISVAYLSAAANFSRDQLNKELLTAEGTMDAIKLIARHKELNGIPVTLKIRYPNGDRTWLPLNAKGINNIELKWIVEQSKSTTSATFKNLNDIRSFFSDTVAVMDTVQVMFNLSDARYNPKGFTVHMGCSLASTADVAEASDSFVLRRNLNCPGGFQVVLIRNLKTGDRILAKSVVHFLNDEEKQELSELLKAAETEEPTANIATLTSYLQEFIGFRHGTMMYSSLLNWVTEQAGKH